MPRCARSSSISRKLSEKRKYSHTAWLIISAGKQNPLSLGAEVFVFMKAFYHTVQFFVCGPTKLTIPPEIVMCKPRPPRPSKLDGYKEQIQKWVMEDHCTNCEVMLGRLQKLGYTGGISILKEFVHPLRPASAGHAPVQRYETKPGEQVQFDWGEFVYEHEGQMHKCYGFTAILGYCRMRFITFVKRCDTPTLIRCFMQACEYFGGLTKVALTDRMKSVLLEMEDNKPRWTPLCWLLGISVQNKVP